VRKPNGWGEISEDLNRGIRTSFHQPNRGRKSLARLHFKEKGSGKGKKRGGRGQEGKPRARIWETLNELESEENIPVRRGREEKVQEGLRSGKLNN